MKKLITILIISAFAQTSFCFAAQNYTYSMPNNYTNNINSEKFKQSPDEQILFIIDYSNSMNEHMGRKPKIDIAMSVMKEILPMIPPATRVGLRVYGHKTGFTPRQSCTASTLLSPIQSNNTANIYSKLLSMEPRGWTRITYSLKQAVFSDFGDSRGKKRIILISDGGENCDESPCEFVIELMKNRDDISVDVIALAIGDKDANNQLRCVSLVTSGKFYTANTASELANSLKDSLRLEKEVQGTIIQRENY